MIPIDVLLQTLGPGGDRLLEESAENGWITELKTDDTTRIAPAWELSTTQDDGEKDRLLRMRLVLIRLSVAHPPGAAIPRRQGGGA